jgi:serine/threonine protein kinase/predicted negative regulator of RcsB-dependent stress response
MIGKSISHYKIIEKLGEGGMGVVYKAHDTKLNREVALKFLPPHISTGGVERERFLQEAQAAAALNHPNICVIYDIKEESEQPYIVMEYVDGTTIRRKLESGPMKMEDAIKYGIQIGEALQEAHSKGIVHRDIKADNVMINSKGQVKVMDFGLAKLKGSLKLTRTSSTVGTLAYMAPEQIQGGDVDARSDIFSFGVLLYELLTRQFPFRGDHEAAMMYSILNEEPESIVKYIPDVSSEVLHIFGRALEKNPEDRYQSIHDMVIDLRRLKKDTTKIYRTSMPAIPITSRADVRSPTADTPETSASIDSETSKRKNRFLLYGGIAVGAILIGVAGYYFMGGADVSSVRVPIVIADFVNETKEPELDGLSGMLITALEQSRRLDVLPRSRMFDILKVLGKNAVDRVDESLGKEICNQAGINSLMLASIRKFGKVYTIDLKVVDPKEGKYLFAATETGEGQESIPSLLDKLSQKTREGFRENRAEIRSASKNVAEITTSNMQAYQHFFQGEQLMNRVKYVEAQEEYRRAVALDSTFGLAYYRLAYATSWETGAQERAKASVQNSMAHIDRIPEKERYLVRAIEAEIYQGFAAGISVLREMEKVYPNEKEMLYNIGDWSYHNSDLNAAAEYLERVLAMDPTMERALEHLSWTYRDTRQYEKMLDVTKRYVAVAGSVEAYDLLMQSYVGLKRLDEGMKTLQQARDLFPSNYQLSGTIANVYTFKEDYNGAESELLPLVKENQALQVRSYASERLATVSIYRGKYQESMRHLEKATEIYWQLHDTVGASRAMMHKALMLVLQNNDMKGAITLAERTYNVQAKTQNTDYWAFLADLYVFRKDVPSAENIFMKRFSTIHWVDPFYRALIYSTNHECTTAETYLDTVLNENRGFKHLNIFLLYPAAQCQFEAGQFDKALTHLALLQETLNNAGGWRGLYYPKSFFLMGKIYEKKGDKKLAIANYEKFLNLWKDADKDLLELIDAKARMTKLKGMAFK